MKLTKKIIIISLIALSFYTKVQENPANANQNLIIVSDNDTDYEIDSIDISTPIMRPRSLFIIM